MEEKKQTEQTAVYHQEPRKQEKQRPVHVTPYSQEIQKHMLKCFPDRQEKVFYDKRSDFLQIDIHMLEAPTNKDFHVLYTVGMSALPMKLPKEFYPEYQMLERAELMVLLPAEWKLEEPSEGEDLNNSLWWPVDLLQYLARFPHEYETWLGWGHTIPNSDQYVSYDEKTTKLCGTMLSSLHENISMFHAKDGTLISFYTLLPLYREEIAFQQEAGSEAMLQKMGDINGFGMIVFPDRPNVCAEEQTEATEA
ncbi:suppressor of fused domain protein [Anaerotignum lactatifermentans]|nr:suppressor of fused domain protein [Anaerotignum lactatifermentans]